MIRLYKTQSFLAYVVIRLINFFGNGQNVASTGSPSVRAILSGAKNDPFVQKKCFGGN